MTTIKKVSPEPWEANLKKKHPKEASLSPPRYATSLDHHHIVGAYYITYYKHRVNSITPCLLLRGAQGGSVERMFKPIELKNNVVFNSTYYNTTITITITIIIITTILN